MTAEIERFNRLCATWRNRDEPMRQLYVVNALRLRGTSNNPFVRRIVSSRGARNPHVTCAYAPVAALRAPNIASPKMNY